MSDQTKQDTDAPEFTAYAVGLCYASVCTTLDDAEATRRLNIQYMTGVGDWQVSPDPTFRGGGPNPGPCDRWPDTHRHILFEC